MMEGERLVAIAGHRLAVVARRGARREIDLEDRRQALDLHWLFVLLRDVRQPLHQLRAATLEVAIDRAVVRFQHVECRQRRGHALDIAVIGAAMHHALWDYFPHKRLGYRVTVKGDKPFYRA